MSLNLLQSHRNVWTVNFRMRSLTIVLLKVFSLNYGGGLVKLSNRIRSADNEKFKSFLDLDHKQACVERQGFVNDISEWVIVLQSWTSDDSSTICN